MTTKLKKSVSHIQTDRQGMQPELPINRQRGITYILVDEPLFLGTSIECDVQWFRPTSDFTAQCLTEITVKISYPAIIDHTKKVCNEKGFRTRDAFVEAYYEDQYKEVIEDYLIRSSEWEVVL